MAAMGELPMPGGGSLSMAWAPMCGQKWPRVAVNFIGMWIVMMMAMMLPSLAPVLWRYHEAIGKAGAMRAGGLTALAGMGYFFVWAVVGVIVFAVGAALFALVVSMPALARTMPGGASVAVMLAGIAQFSRWKLRYLSCSRALISPGGVKHGMREAWSCGMRLGTHCMFCCSGLTLVLLVNGVMNLVVMVFVTLSISVERMARWPDRVARAVGGLVLIDGVVMGLRVLFA
ncbi:DUF2182 domain-containing protein [Paraburkholderia sp. C35]|uniref:DUF2182 domain-containing protein n=1 Tax=Paraburkholderia sp. C35 TaxID=2126993 RepID=UPI000D695439|nr:DUF2182 domain-containing protein [Paraburkholderia sp. C35]